MKFELKDEDKLFLAKALNYVVLSLDGNATDNSALSDTEKLHIIGQCYYLQQMLANADND